MQILSFYLIFYNNTDELYLQDKGKHEDNLIHIA